MSKRLDKDNKWTILYNISGGRLAQSVEQGTENPRVPSSILGPATIFVSTPVNPTGFFVFSPKNYPQKPPCGVSGKLSATQKTGKVAHLLRFFGKYLCHLRFLTQYVTYYKSTLVYYNIPGSFSQAAIHTENLNNQQSQKLFPCGEMFAISVSA